MAHCKRRDQWCTTSTKALFFAVVDTIGIIRIDWPVFPRCSHWMQWLKAVCRSTLWCQLLRPTSWEKWGAKCANHSTILIQTRASCKHSTASPEEDQVQPRSQCFFPALGTRLDQVTTSGSLHLRKSGFRSPGNLCRRNCKSWALESGIQLKESGIPLTIGVQKSSRKEFGNHLLESLQNSRLSWISIHGVKQSSSQQTVNPS